MNIESMLIDKVGDIGKKIHSGRSRNDQVALDIRFQFSTATKNRRSLYMGIIGPPAVNVYVLYPYE